MPQSTEVTEKFTKEVEVEFEVITWAGFDPREVAPLLHKHMRAAGLIKFENPDDDHPNLAMCGSLYRSSIERAASDLSDEIGITVRTEQT